LTLAAQSAARCMAATMASTSPEPLEAAFSDWLRYVLVALAAQAVSRQAHMVDA
jgi:hypothetical protein